MANDHKFKVLMNPIGDFNVGEGETNQFEISIAYNGNDKIQLDDCSFRLQAGVGDQKTDLVLSEAKADKISTEANRKVTIDKDTSEKKHVVWEIFPEEPTLFEMDTQLTIKFSNIESNTRPGVAELLFESEILDEEAEKQTLSLSKKSDNQAGIIYFYTTTEERLKSATTTNSIFPADEQILSGEDVTLNWNVKNLPHLTLKKGGSNITITPDEERKCEKKVAHITEDTDFVLSGLDNRGAEISAKVSVKVLKPGWHDSTTTIEGTLLEPTCLFNSDADNQIVFAVFRRKHPEKEDEGLILKTENPFWGWTQMPMKVPKGFVTSPGVYYDKKLWLIGGSQIDPEITSNEVWYIEPFSASREWKKLEPPAKWCPRMGHAVLVYDNKIWVMGGCDVNGNALKDYYKFDFSTKIWSEKATAPWRERCMFSAVVFNNDNNREIWLCGGVTEPFSGDFLYPDFLYIYNPEEVDKWKGPVKASLGPDGPGAVCLQVFRYKGEGSQDLLHLIGQTAGKPFKTFFYRLNQPTMPDAWAVLPSDQLQGWAEDQTVAYQLVNFKNKLMIAKALGYDNANFSLKVFIP